MGGTLSKAAFLVTLDGEPEAQAPLTTMDDHQAIRVGDIQRFCVQDGPGIRTTVFVQGCPLRCWWCHNAHMQAAEPEGSPRGISELVDDVSRDARYWRASNGGVTLSGGEPLLQQKACAAFLAALAGKGYHTCVETSGYAPPDALSTMDEVTALFLFDLKTVDADAFRRATAGYLTIVLENLRHLLRRRADSVWLRIPLIEGFNADEGNLRRIGRFVSSLPAPARLQLLPGHRMGVMGRKDPTVDADCCHRALAIMRHFDGRAEICW